MNLPTITISASTPSWALPILAVEQARADNDYLAAVAAYASAGKEWIDQNLTSRAISPDPATYMPTPFTREIPKRLQITGWDTALNGATSTTYTDPGIHPPVFPPWVAPVPPVVAGGFATGAPAQAASDASFQATVMQYLIRIAAKVGA
jgi:hypothetical protein